MKVLVLGGTRFVGKRLVHLLADQGHDVTVGSRGRAHRFVPEQRSAAEAGSVQQGFHG